MMQFRVIKQAIVDLLGDEANNRFRVMGFQKQSKHANEFTGNDRLVQVYYRDGNFPKNSGRMTDSKTHDISIDLDLTTSAAATGDLSVLESDTSTPIQKAAAIAAIKEASEIADVKMDELIENVYQILMDARNIHLGLEVGDISSRWIDRIQKDTLLERGNLVVKTANLKYSCRVQEYVLGAVGNEPSTVIFNSQTPVDGGSSTGVTVENDNT